MMANIREALNIAEQNHSKATVLLRQKFSQQDAAEIVDCIIKAACIEFAVAQAKAAEEVLGI